MTPTQKGIALAAGMGALAYLLFFKKKAPASQPQRTATVDRSQTANQMNPSTRTTGMDVPLNVDGPVDAAQAAAFQRMSDGVMEGPTAPGEGVMVGGSDVADSFSPYQ